jgi:hypothetical protein
MFASMRYGRRSAYLLYGWQYCLILFAWCTSYVYASLQVTINGSQITLSTSDPFYKTQEYYERKGLAIVLPLRNDTICQFMDITNDKNQTRAIVNMARQYPDTGIMVPWPIALNVGCQSLQEASIY